MSALMALNQINAACAKSRNQRYESWRMLKAHSSLVIHRVRMPFGIPRMACCGC